MGDAPENYFGIADDRELEILGGELAARRLAELERAAPLTMVHPFRDGNSRTQRYFFDQLLRNSGWALDWTRINAEQVHAARYVGAATVDASYLAQALQPGLITAGKSGSLAETEGLREDRVAAEIFHDMMHLRRTHPRGTAYRLR